MKTPLRIITIAALYVTLLTIDSSCQEKERRANLQGYWKFILGDNMKFAKPEYNDADWEKIYVPDAWQDEGFRNYHGYAWYRKTVEIEMESNDILYLELGRIDDVDEVYVNGHLVGSTGGFPPDYVTAYNYHRRYLLPVEHLNKNGKNVIAVRVYDEHGEGGIIGSPVGIYHYPNYSENSINLFGKWKFHLFDNMEWSKENFDDSEWESILVPSLWEDQGFRGYDGFAWYRKTFKLPGNFEVDDLMLLLGKIDDMDEVYVNGTRIGGTGNINKKWASNDEYNRYRNYSVPDDLLRPGRENVIAIRVYDQQQGGGIYEGPITILPRSEYKQFWRNYREENYDFHHWVSHYFFDN
jgi:sialate O-acetylesterase